MNKRQLERWGYIRPECEIIETNTEQFICVSVRTNVGASTSPSNTQWDDKGEHNVGTIVFGDESSVAPAKGGWFDEEEE